jgi:hypothetical protein
MEPEVSLPWWKELATGSCPEADKSNQHHDILFLSRFILILSPHLRLGLSNGRLPFNLFVRISHLFSAFYLPRPSRP